MSILAASFFDWSSALFLGSWLLMIFEMIGMWLFFPFVYKFGLRIMSREIMLGVRPDVTLIEERGETEKGKFRKLKDGRILFREKFYLFKIFRISTPFPIRAILTMRGNAACIEGRIPLGMTLFFVFFLCEIISLDSLSKIAGSFFILLLIFGLSILLEIYRIKKVSEEMSEYLQSLS